MNNFEVVIGIEIHIELNTKTKMFSHAPNSFGLAENTSVAPLDLAYPGTLPVVNKQAVIKAIMLGKALKMEIDDLVRFDRKNYYYPDLPKGFQITQQYHPIGKDGIVKISNKEITLERIHMEEDTAKAFHNDDATLLNYNRAGVPLIEIVSNPVMHNSQEATEYIETIKNVALALDISDAKMEEGSLRADINISLRPFGQKELGTKVEIKNMNSLSNVKKAIDFEIIEQTKQILLGIPVLQTTKRFDETTQTNAIMRTKKDALDYGYMPEPNILPIRLPKELINGIVIPELPWERKERYLKDGLDIKTANILVSDLALANYFDSIEYKDRVKLSKILFAELVSLANANSKSVVELNILPEQIAILLSQVSDGIISGKHLKTIIPFLIDGQQTVEQVIKEKGMAQISDPIELQKIIEEILNDSKDFIEQNSDRPERVLKYVLGQVMKKSKGQANPVVSSELVRKVLIK